MPEPGLVPFVQVADVDVAGRFYEALGFERAWEHRAGDDGPRVHGLVRRGVRLYLTEMDESAVGLKVYLWVDDFDAMLGRVRERGVPFELEAQHAHFGARELRLHDPDGNRIFVGDAGARP